MVGDGIDRRLSALLGSILDRDAAEMTRERRLAELGFDSLAYAELAPAVLAELGVRLPDARPDEVATVDDLARVLRRAGTPGPGGEAELDGTGRLQRPARALGGAALRWWFSVRVVGVDRVPPTGPAVLAMNHESFLDIPLIAAVSPRRITFMAKRELFKNQVVSRLLRELGGFPVDRDRFDLRALDLAVEVIRRGELLGMYPEGTRVAGEMLPFLPGAAWVALRTGATILPIAIEGTDLAMPPDRRWPRRAQVRVTIGDAIPVDLQPEPGRRLRDAALLTERLEGEIRRLLGR